MPGLPVGLPNRVPYPSRVLLFHAESTPPARTGQHSTGANLDILKYGTIIGEAILPYLIGVFHAAGFKDIQAAVAFTGGFNVPQQYPGVHQ